MFRNISRRALLMPKAKLEYHLISFAKIRPFVCSKLVYSFAALSWQLNGQRMVQGGCASHGNVEHLPTPHLTLYTVEHFNCESVLLPINSLLIQTQAMNRKWTQEPVKDGRCHRFTWGDQTHENTQSSGNKVAACRYYQSLNIFSICCADRFVFQKQ